MYRRLPAGKGRVDPKGVVEAQMPARRRRYDFFSRPVSPWLDRVREIHRHIGIEPFIPYNAAQEKQPITPSVYSRAKNTDESSWRSAMSSHMERRRYPRVGCRLPMVSQPGSPALEGIVCDLSLDGLRLQTAQHVKAGQIYPVHLILPSRSA